MHAAILAAGLGNSRDALLAGLNQGFVAALPIGKSPSECILSDLGVLNSTGALPPDGNLPLVLWLVNARALAGPRPEATLFGAAIDRCHLTLEGSASTRIADEQERAVEVRLFNLGAAVEWTFIVEPATTLLQLVGQLKETIRSTPWKAQGVRKPGAGYLFRCYWSETDQVPLSLHLTTSELLPRASGRGLSLNVEWYVAFRGGVAGGSR